MVGHKSLNEILTKLNLFTNRVGDPFFSDIHVAFFGDFHQLRPVLERHLGCNISAIPNIKDRFGIEQFRKQNLKVIELTVNHRCSNDYGKFLDQLRLGNFKSD